MLSSKILAKSTCSIASRTGRRVLNQTRRCHNHHNVRPSTTTALHPVTTTDNDDDNNSNPKKKNVVSFLPPATLNAPPLQQQHQQRRYYNATSSRPVGSTSLIMGLGAVALTAKAGQYTIQAYDEWKASQPEVTEEDEQQQQEKARAKTASAGATDDSDTTTKSQKSGKRENIFAKWFGLGVGSKYYEGGFEEKMTRREAALILGVRESATTKRIKEGHRKLLILNHPDTGGSKLISGKINEAKELLLKGK